MSNKLHEENKELKRKLRLLEREVDRLNARIENFRLIELKLLSDLIHLKELHNIKEGNGYETSSV